MHNNTHRNQQLKRDRLFLERIFLLDIEQRKEADATDEVSLSMPQETRKPSNISAHFPKSSTAPITEKQLASSISDDEDLEQYLEATPLFEVELEASSKSPDSQPIPLFDDEDLARYLNSATLFDDDILKQKLGIAPGTPAIANIEPESAVREKVISKLHSGLTEPSSKDLAQLSLTKEHGKESKVELPLFADEDLRQFLSSTPLMSDEILKQKLNLKR